MTKRGCCSSFLVIGGDPPCLVGVDEGVHPVGHRHRRHRNLPVPPLLAAVGLTRLTGDGVSEEAVLL